MKPKPKQPRTYTVRLEDGRHFVNLRKREAKGVAQYFERDGLAATIEPEPEERSAIDLVPELAVFDVDADEPPSCEMCMAPSHRQNVLGALGKREYFRCSACGFTHARRNDEMAI